MRNDRTPGKGSGTHSLIFARKGTNRFTRGSYVCKCGQKFTGLNAYELHRANERRNARKVADD
jgi:hypothetical protein